jgi:hypothetical protein
MDSHMTAKLSKSSYAFAKALIAQGKAVLDSRDDWSEHQPTAEDENRFIEKHGIAEFRRWHLGVDESEPEQNKSRYKYPYGDFKKAHRCAVLAIESRAGQYKHSDIALAAAHLHGMLDELMAESSH